MNSTFFTQGIAFGLLSNLSWGTGDLGFAYASRKLGSIATVLFSQGGSAIILLLYALLTTSPINLNLSVAVLSVAAGILHTIANLSFSQGLKLGKVALVSPVAAGYSILLVLTGVIIFGDKPTLVQFLAILSIIVGTIIVSTNLKQLFRSQKLILSDPGIPYALLTFVLWPIGYLLIKQAVNQSGWITPNLILFATQFIAVATYASLARQKINTPSTKLQTGAILLNSFGNTGGYVGYSLGVTRGLISIVGPISAAFPAVTIILARIFFRETIDKFQALSILAILTGIVLLSV